MTAAVILPAITAAGMVWLIATWVLGLLWQHYIDQEVARRIDHNAGVGEDQVRERPKRVTT